MVRGMTRRGTSTAMMSRATPILGLFFVVVAQLSAFLHLAAVPHELCREHGELVEGGAVDGEANQDRPDDVPVDGDHRHDHCPQLTHPPQALQAQPLLVLLPGSALVHAPGGMPARAPAPVEPLSFAPKTSPPARLI